MSYSVLFVKMVGFLYPIFVLLFVVGFIQSPPQEFITFTFLFKVMVALFLLYRFNPYFNTRVHFTKLDQTIVMASAFFILIDSLNDYIDPFINWARKVITQK